ncbi:NADH-dependent phenylglyoxylate dehydrogenase subunit beta [Aromatoleum petrolei]|uniref:Phenylglyoxylate dehydrogenase n=1 Tax=Aromatoleum petrolei TaxID=76116 RepID=A0ABX1MJU3_9RHOO|nr:thiamine pyrophosphate-dependent enzyme [Aromatoleum petrolei]NMF88235.1 phenylglyoxylate dehydrogenase [Aromatoleum petrolei]QTQ38064.1 Phenylglyoxylate:acceptor oxidoreductase [Aromatoleum petrolei]
MGRAYSTIAFDPAKCDGCGDCMTACAQAKTGTDDIARSRIQIYGRDGAADKTFELALCRQCADPKCVTVCPAGALSKDGTSGVIGWDASKCVDCLLCTVGCSYAGIALDETTGHVSKCDTCDGNPACVPACSKGALKYITTANIYNEVGDWEDLFAPGLAGCQGCNTELLMRHTLRRVGPDTVLATPPGCVPGMGSVGFNGTTGTKVPVFHPLLTNTAAMLAGIKRQYKRVGRDVQALAIAGDGGASDVGFQSLSGAAERGEQMLFMVVDNEGYMNTGMQRSSCTPYGAWTSTTPVGETQRGKTQDAKNLPLIMVNHRCAYVATASTAYMEDLYDKLDKAIAASKTGFAYLHVYSPCTTGWRFPSNLNMEVARKAVETNFVMLWEYTPQDGLHFTKPVDDPLPVTDYLKAMGRFRHLSPEQVEHIQKKVVENQKFVERMTEHAHVG